MNAAVHFCYDAFVSYRWAEPDLSWVRHQFVPGLRTAGVNVCLDVHDFVPGRDLILEMARAGRESRRAICVLSPDYFAGNRFVHFESLMARRSDPSGSDGKLIPLILRRCDLPDWIRGLIPIDWTRPDSRTWEWRKLLDVLGAPVRTAACPAGAESPGGIPDEPAMIFDAVEAARAVETAKTNAGIPGELIARLPRTPDPTERYWLYIALGTIGGDAAHRTLVKAESESNPFARAGVDEALARFPTHPPPSTAL